MLCLRLHWGCYILASDTALTLMEAVMEWDNPHVIYEKKGQIAYLTMNRPERMNALGRDISRGLQQGVTDFRNDPEMRVLIITGAGDRAFCAGGDLKEMADRSRSGEPTIPATATEVATPELIMTTYNKPVIAAINGVAAGGGCELAACCDIRVGTPNTRMGCPESRVGLGAHVGTVMLPRMLPMGIALEALFTARLLSAEECEKWGLINRIVPQDELMSYCTELAEKILDCAPLSVARQKHNAYKSSGLPLPYAFHINAGPDVYGEQGAEDRVEGARAFAEKRRPSWKARITSPD